MLSRLDEFTKKLIINPESKLVEKFPSIYPTKFLPFPTILPSTLFKMGLKML